jgi:hypothetical protein
VSSGWAFACDYCKTTVFVAGQPDPEPPVGWVQLTRFYGAGAVLNTTHLYCGDGCVKAALASRLFEEAAMDAALKQEATQ